MNLLPKEHKDFGKENYWNEFFSKTKSQPFEWYGEFNSLCETLDKYIKSKEKILIVGCGNSRLSADLYDIGIQNMISIDISETVIKLMKEKYGKVRPAMSFEKMDVLKLTFEREIFSVVLDKGTLDAIMVDSSEETVGKVNLMFSEISRVLKYGGRYICISLLQEHILEKILEWFVNEGWMVRIHRCFEAEKNHNSMTFPVFIVILIKMKKVPGFNPILELAIEAETSLKRIESKQLIIDSIKSIQYYAFIRHSFSKSGKLVGDHVCLELCCQKTEKVKYRLYVVDIDKTAPLKFAVFIVPQGRETEWLFATTDGRKELAEGANCERIVVVHLSRSFTYENLDEVKNDLSGKVMELAPSSLRSQVPFLSIGDDVGVRTIQAKGRSEISGEYVIEDVVGEDKQMFRRLIFLDTPYFIQSEAKLIKVSPKKKKKKKKKKEKSFSIDLYFLACNHHAAMISGLAFLKSEISGAKILQIGLGGGSLAMYLHQHLRNNTIEVVELDETIVKIAKEWFGVVLTEKGLTIYVDDGVSFIQKAASEGNHYDVIMLDVDSKDPSLGISSPPPAFTELVLLLLMSQLVGENGVVILNLVCRNVALRNEVLRKIQTVFPNVLQTKVPNEVNEIIYCFNATKSSTFEDDLKLQIENLTKMFKTSKSENDELDFGKLLSCLKSIT